MDLESNVPTFVCPGAAKSGTTTLYTLLQSHPDIYLSPTKETGFFSINQRYSQGFDWYLNSYYKKAVGYKAIGDISTSYMPYSELAASRIHKHLGSKTKFIFMLRNPIDRSYSHYNMRKYNNLSENTPFDDLVNQLDLGIRMLSPEVKSRLACAYGSLNENDKQLWKMLNYFYVGNYSRALNDYFKFFSREQILIIRFEDFVASQNKQMQMILEFLNVDDNAPLYSKSVYSNEAGKVKLPFLHHTIRKSYQAVKLFGLEQYVTNNANIKKWFYRYKNWNRTKHAAPSMSLSTRKKLTEYYKPEIVNLEELTGMRFHSWLS